MDYSDLDDEVLLGLIAHRRAEALSALYDRYGRLVFSLALNSVGSPAAAEEITQDVFLRVWERANTYRAEKAKVSTWLTSIARYRSIDILRRRSARPEQHSVRWADVAPADMPREDETEAAVELSLQRQRVREAIAELPEEQQQVLALAYFQGYTHRQISDALGQPLGTVKTRIRLAMQKLRSTLQNEESPA